MLASSASHLITDDRVSNVKFAVYRRANSQSPVKKTRRYVSHPPYSAPKNDQQQSVIGITDPTACYWHKMGSPNFFSLFLASIIIVGMMASDHSAQETESTSSRIVDIISTGSNSRPEYQLMQSQTFASHEVVRTFYPITEHNDTDGACVHHVNVKQVVNFCHRETTYSSADDALRHRFARTGFLLQKSNPAGWLCAQKRALDGLNAVVLAPQYQIPDYLFIIDDDTWLDLDAIIPTIQEAYAPTEHHVVAGCLMHTEEVPVFSFPWGGFGLLLTKAVIKRLLTPLLCDGYDNDSPAVLPQNVHSDFVTDQDFVKFACQRISMNWVGERHFFKPGMSLLQLMYQHSAQQPFTNASSWAPTAGFCMHSDSHLAYFLQYYHVGRHVRDQSYQDPQNRMAAYMNSTWTADKLRGRPRMTQECKHIHNAGCREGAHMCHFVTPELMKRLHLAKNSGSYPLQLAKLS